MKYLLFFPFILAIWACHTPACDKKSAVVKSDSVSTGPLFSFEEKELYGFKDAKGSTVIPAKYRMSFTDTFRHAVAFVADSAEGIIAIDRWGKTVLHPFVYDNGPDYVNEGLFRFIENKKLGFADEEGNVVIPAKYDFVTEFKEGMACFGSGFTLKQEGEIQLMKGGKWGFINKKGETVIPPTYDEMSYFEDGKCTLKLNGKSMTIDKTGKEVK